MAKKKNKGRNFTAMWRWRSNRLCIRIISQFFFVTAPSCHVNHTELAIVVVVLGLSQNHRLTKPQLLSYFLGFTSEGFQCNSYTRCEELNAYFDLSVSCQSKFGMLF